MSLFSTTGKLLRDFINSLNKSEFKTSINGIEVLCIST